MTIGHNQPPKPVCEMCGAVYLAANRIHENGDPPGWARWRFDEGVFLLCTPCQHMFQRNYWAAA